MDQTPFNTNRLIVPKTLRTQPTENDFLSKFVKPVGQGLLTMGKQLGGAIGQGFSGGFGKVGETIQKTPLLRQGVGALNLVDYGLGTVAKTTEGLLTDRMNTLRNLKYQPGEGIKSYAQRNVSDITPYVSEKVAGTQMGQRMPLLAPMLGLGAGMISPSPSDFLKVGKVATQAGDVAKFSDEATDLVKPSMLDPLASEAKKYKSAEEFINAQPIYYRATEDGKTLGVGQKWAWMDRKTAETWAKRNDAKVVEFTVPDESIDGVDLQRIKKGTTDRFVFDTSKALTKSQLTDIWNKANQSNDLISEAKKYKSATQFRNALNINYRDSWAGDKDVNADQMLKLFGGKVFHGTNASKEILAGGYKKGDYFNSGAYFSDTPERAIEYMKENRSRVGKNSNDVLVNDLSNLKIKQGEGEIVREISKAYDGTEEYVNKLKKQGFDGIKDAYGETLVWNVEKIKKPETLTDIWNKAHGK